ncbi:MAG: TIGR03936 family radical SAM-associated protein, partial [Jaaginema sp. PMC 1079.18]|nr:TIGR03936 family radical SAM-associated protein [Jaaginema sp. PMC 1079.18]
LERVVRRAALPISFSGGYHPMPKIAIANALSLGMTSSDEIVDFELTERLDIDEFLRLLAEKLPADLPIYDVAEIDLKAPSANKLLHQAEYIIDVSTEDNISWSDWLEKVNQSSEILWGKKTKSGKMRQINLRDRLHDLQLLETQNNTAKIRFIGSCTNDGSILKPEHLIVMLEQISGQNIELLHAHRQQLILVES